MPDFKNLKQLRAGDEITDFFVIRKKELRTKKVDGSPYLALELGNPTGRISATLWHEVKEALAEYQTGNLVKAFGKVIDYKGGNTLVIEKIRKVKQEDNLRPHDFLPPPKRNPKNVQKELELLIRSVTNTSLNQLLTLLFQNDNFLKTYKNAPAGKLWHHNRTGGLIEHSLAVAGLCNFIAKKTPGVNRDLLITGALLHDIGKIYSYRTDLGFIDYSDEGRLIGHLSIGANWLNQIFNQLQDFPEELKKQLLHLILSHHGELEKGSPVVPMTLEALILNHADELDSKIDAYLRIAENEKEGGIRWSNYVRLVERFFYFPPEPENLNPDEQE